MNPIVLIDGIKKVVMRRAYKLGHIYVFCDKHGEGVMCEFKRFLGDFNERSYFELTCPKCNENYLLLVIYSENLNQKQKNK